MNKSNIHKTLSSSLENVGFEQAVEQCKKCIYQNCKNILNKSGVGLSASMFIKLMFLTKD